MTERERFESLIEFGDEGAHWRWRGATIDGEPIFFLDGEPMDPVRLAWALWHRRAPGDAEIVADCDTPTCLNPAHARAI